eukprot:5413243-Prymnesium_polylepis.2
MVARPSMWQHVAARGSTWQHVAARGSMWQHVEARGSTWQHVAACGSMWQHVAAHGLPALAPGTATACPMYKVCPVRRSCEANHMPGCNLPPSRWPSR